MPASPVDEQSIPLREGAGAVDWSVDDVFVEGKTAVGGVFSNLKNGVSQAWAKTTRRMRTTVGILLVMYAQALARCQVSRITVAQDSDPLVLPSNASTINIKYSKSSFDISRVWRK